MKMYKNDVEMEVNPTPQGIASLEKYGWSQDKPKEKKEKKEDSKDLFKE